MVCQIRKDGKLNIILSKTRSVLPETELLAPTRNLLHRLPFADLSWPNRATGPVLQGAYSTIRSAVNRWIKRQSRCHWRDPCVDCSSPAVNSLMSVGCHNRKCRPAGGQRVFSKIFLGGLVNPTI